MIVDNDGQQMNPELRGAYKKLIEVSGLELFGHSNFEKPDPNKVLGTYNVVGFILKK